MPGPGVWASGALHLLVALTLLQLGEAALPPPVPQVIPVTLVPLQASPPAMEPPIPTALPPRRPLAAKAAMTRQAAAPAAPATAAAVAQSGSVPEPSPLAADDAAAPSAPEEPPAPAHLSRPSPEYMGSIQRRLVRVKHYPALARSQGKEGTVMVRIILDRRGNVLASRIESSSGTPSLDDATTQMVQQAAPFPPFPDDLDEDRLELVVPVQFSLAR